MRNTTKKAEPKMLILRPVKKVLKGMYLFLTGYLRSPGYTWGGRLPGFLWFGVGPGLEMIAEKLTPTSTAKNRSQHSQQGTDNIL